MPAAWPGWRPSRPTDPCDRGAPRGRRPPRRDRSGSLEQPGADEQLVDEADAEADGRAGLPRQLVLQQRQAGFPGARGEPPARGDHGDRQVPLTRCGEAGERLRRLARVARGNDQRSLARAGRQAVVTMHDERHPQPVARRRGDELRADGRAAHGQHDDGIDVGVALVEADRCGDASRLGELGRQGGNPTEHVLGIDAPQRGRVIQRDRILEERGAVAVFMWVGIRSPGLLVGVLVAEEVAGIHQRRRRPAIVSGLPREAPGRPRASAPRRRRAAGPPCR